jgi:UDP-N-acetylmuramoylalanine--D-glutamate ligase
MFDLLEQINQDTIIVAELSSHQLEYIKISPRIAVLLNLYQEHLDHYKSFKDYKNAKLNITRYQTETDYFIYNNDDISIKALLGKNVYKRNYYQYSLSNIDIEQGTFLKDHVIFAVKDGNNIDYSYDTHNKRNLIGEHNLYNIMAAINVCRILNIQNDFITNGINSFKGLEHRIEYVGDFDGVSYYNDSISTIPEATIQAVNALKSVNTILLGGFDRGIDYNQLIDFIIKSNIENIIFISSAGHRMLDIYKNTINNSKNNNNKTRQNIYFTNNFEDAVRHAQKLTKKGEICLLSPAAASYDMFHNFEERGNYFKQLIKKT